MSVEKPASFPIVTKPDWVTKWVNGRNKRSDKKRTRQDSQLVPQLFDHQRQTTIMAGLLEFELWLRDLMRNGLASARHKPNSYWKEMANRLVDVQAMGMAKELERLSALPTETPDWPEKLLSGIGRLYLLIQGFKNFETLTPATQADLQTAVGWLPKGLNQGTNNIFNDYWHIMGRQVTQTGKRQIQHIWLWGQKSNKPAQIMHVAHGRRNLDYSLVTGTIWKAQLSYYQGAVPLQAHFVRRFGFSQPEKPVIGYASILEAATAFSQSLAVNPWWQRFPIALQAVIPDHHGNHWFVHDESGHVLPLPANYKYGWHLRAVSGGQALSLFGVWNGSLLLPLTVWADGRYLSLDKLRGVG